MTKKINVRLMTDNALETLRSNINYVTQRLMNNPHDSDWLEDLISGDIYFEKNYKIPDFTLKISDDGDYSKVDYDNSITLYESLKDLPRYIVTDERFWAWINFEKGYQAALQAMPINNKTTVFELHWLFKGGNKRGLAFGVLSRCFLRVMLTIDERLSDKYELTKFVVENPERFRNLTWRSFSNQEHLVLGILKAEKKVYEEYGDKLKNSMFSEIAKYVSKIGSVRLLDVITEEDIYDFVYNKLVDMIKERDLVKQKVAVN